MSNERLRRGAMIGGVGCLSTPVAICVGLIGAFFFLNSPLWADMMLTFKGKHEVAISGFSSPNFDTTTSRSGRYIRVGLPEGERRKICLWHLAAGQCRDFAQRLILTSKWIDDNIILVEYAPSINAVELIDGEKGVLPLQNLGDLPSTPEGVIQLRDQDRQLLAAADTVYFAELSQLALLLVEKDGSFSAYTMLITFLKEDQEKIFGDVPIKDLTYAIPSDVQQITQWGMVKVSPSGNFYVEARGSSISVMSMKDNSVVASAWKPLRTIVFKGWGEEDGTVYFTDDDFGSPVPWATVALHSLAPASPVEQAWNWLWPLLAVGAVVGGVRWWRRRRTMRAL